MLKKTFTIFLLGSSIAVAADAKYFTWVDEHGKVHNTPLDSNWQTQQQKSERQSKAAKKKSKDNMQAQWPGSHEPNEARRRYFTWVDGTGTLQNNFYVKDPALTFKDDYLLPSGQRSSDYLDADLLEGKTKAINAKSNSYFTWTDEQGRTQNSVLPNANQSTDASNVVAASGFSTTEKREVRFDKPLPALPGLDGQPTDAMKSLLNGTADVAAPFEDMTRVCCGQLSDEEFTSISPDRPHLEEMNDFSPSFDFPTGKSFYAAFELPDAMQNYALRLRSFANKKVIYPSLLFLDHEKNPTRLVSDAVYQLHPETWVKHAYIEGVVKVEPERGERYVLIMTTNEDKAIKTYDNRPFKRPLQDLTLNESGIQVHEHADMGSFEIAIVK